MEILDEVSNEKLSVRALTKAFGNNMIFENLSFEVKDGEFLSILGPSGCGKTTILRILIGLLPPTSGAVWKDGRNITAAAPADRGMGIVFQNYALFQNMTVLQNVEYALKRKKSLAGHSREIAQSLVEQVGLKEHIAKKPDKLSGGQQQRVAIARTLALKPDVILFDEPMSALDVATRLTLRTELKSLQRAFGTTMIYITHDQEEAFSLSDRILVMNEGRIHQLGTPQELIEAPADDFVKKFVVHNLQAKLDSLNKYMGSAKE